MYSFRLYRAADWTPEAHAACDTLEAAVDRVTKARDAGTLMQALDDHTAATAAFGRAMLDLDKHRRPHVYKAVG